MNENIKNFTPRLDKAISIFKKYGGMLRTTQALRENIHPETLYRLHKSGVLEKVSRGLYRLSESQPMGNPDLVTVAARIPQGVICLISALAFHELTTQIPHEVHIALPRGAEEPRLGYPPLRTYHFTGTSFTEGIESHQLDNIKVQVYNPEKTLADCFKFRNQIGLDVAVEAVRLYHESGTIRMDALMHYAGICRVKKIIRPYLEAIL